MAKRKRYIAGVRLWRLDIEKPETLGLKTARHLAGRRTLKVRHNDIVETRPEQAKCLFTLDQRGRNYFKNFEKNLPKNMYLNFRIILIVSCLYRQI